MEEFTIRRATVDDIASIVALLADDALGRTRESPADPTPYQEAFHTIDADPHHLLVVMERDGEVIGTAQLTFIRGMARRGATRAQIEAVRIGRQARGGGLGSRLIDWCIKRARDEGCALVQLTSDSQRQDAHRFYTTLGFQASHVGFKLAL